MLPELKRFYTHVVENETTGCHEWLKGARNKGSYGQFSVRRARTEKRSSRWGNRRVLAHKWLFETVYGEVERGHEVHHRCCNPKCVNLYHLRETTKAENLALRGKGPEIELQPVE